MNPTLYISEAGAILASREALQRNPDLNEADIRRTTRRNPDDRTIETGFTVWLKGRPL